MVSDIYTGKASANPTNLTNVNGTLFFSRSRRRGPNCEEQRNRSGDHAG